MSRIRAAAGMVVAASIIALPAVVVSASPQSLAWKPCRDAKQYRCATLVVPLDRANPKGASIGIGLTMAPATKKAKRLGSLLVNPGGPGASGQRFVRQLANGFSPAVRERYDLIGWDPRGIGGSSEIRCFDSVADYDAFFHVDLTPDSAVELAALDEQARRFGEGCKKRSDPALLRFTGTADVVADMESIRVALGESRLNFLGFSYGTLLGLRYADAYPAHSGRLVLDGVLDPAADTVERAKQQAAGFDRALDGFLSLCRPKGAVSCSWAKDGESVGDGFDRLLRSVDEAPLVVKRSSGKRELGPSEVISGTLAALYNRDFGWPRLQQALSALADGDGGPMLAMSDAYLDRSAEGYGNVTDVNAAVSCLDAPAGKTMSWYSDLAERLTKGSPRFGAFAAFSNLNCLYWPVGPRDSPRAVSAEGAAPILLIGTLRDPATPYVWAAKVHKAVKRSTLLTYDSDGHTAYFSGNSCVQKSVEEYLLVGRVPPAGTVCKRT